MPQERFRDLFRHHRTGGQSRSGDETATRRRTVRLNPAIAGIEELTGALGTDPEAGLSPKEAAKRLRRASLQGKKPLFATVGMTPSACIKKLCREPILWLFLAVCISALFFDRVALGLACAGLVLAHGAVCVFCLYRAALIDQTMQTGDNPLCRVVRSGHIQRLSSDGVVRGDILLLYAGDTVPADGRLLSASPDFSVTERELEGNAALSRPVRLSKDPNAKVKPEGRFLHSPPNMVFAGGVVESGQARVLAVAVGLDTHLGGLCGGLAPTHPSKPTGGYRKAKKILDIGNLTLLVAVIPAVGIGILTLGGTYDLLDLVMSALSLCVTGLTSHTLALGLHAGASLRDAAATDRDTESTADIKTSATLEQLNRMDELILVGTAALHDGVCHPETLTVGNRTYDCAHPEADEMAGGFAEGAYLTMTGLASLTDSTRGECLPVPETVSLQQLQSVLGAVCDWAEMDTEAVRLRVDSITVISEAGDKSSGDWLAGWSVRVVWKRGITVTYRLTEDGEAVALCTMMPDGQRYRPMEEADRDALLTAAREARLTGYRICFLLSRRDGQTCVEGMIAYAPHTCRKTQGTVKALEAAGIRVTAFLRTISDENTRVLSECGLTETAPSGRPEKGRVRRPAAELREGGIRAFEGCDTAYILDYIVTRRNQGAVVGVLSVEREDLRMLGNADIVITCAPGLYAISRESGTPLSPVRLPPDGYTGPDGTPDSACAADLSRRRADVLVRRVRGDGGGVMGVRQALLAADRYRNSSRSLTRFLLVSHILRLLFLLVPLCAGLSLVEAPMLLLSGLAVDLAAALSLACPDVPAELTSRKAGAVTVFDKFPRAFRAECVAALLSAVTPWIIAWGGSAMSVKFGMPRIGIYGFLSLLCIQMTAFAADRVLLRRTRLGLLFPVALLCLWLGSLAVALGGGLRPMWAMIFPLAGSAVYAVALAVGRAVEKGREKHRLRTEASSQGQ